MKPKEIFLSEDLEESDNKEFSLDKNVSFDFISLSDDDTTNSSQTKKLRSESHKQSPISGFIKDTASVSILTLFGVANSSFLTYPYLMLGLYLFFTIWQLRVVIKKRLILAVSIYALIILLVKSIFLICFHSLNSSTIDNIELMSCFGLYISGAGGVWKTIINELIVGVALLTLRFFTHESNNAGLSNDSAFIEALDSFFQKNSESQFDKKEACINFQADRLLPYTYLINLMIILIVSINQSIASLILIILVYVSSLLKYSKIKYFITMSQGIIVVYRMICQASFNINAISNLVGSRSLIILGLKIQNYYSELDAYFVALLSVLFILVVKLFRQIYLEELSKVGYSTNHDEIYVDDKKELEEDMDEKITEEECQQNANSNDQEAVVEELKSEGDDDCNKKTKQSVLEKIKRLNESQSLSAIKEENEEKSPENFENLAKQFSFTQDNKEPSELQSITRISNLNHENNQELISNSKSKLREANSIRQHSRGSKSFKQSLTIQSPPPSKFQSLKLKLIEVMHKLYNQIMIYLSSTLDSIISFLKSMEMIRNLLRIIVIYQIINYQNFYLTFLLIWLIYSFKRMDQVSGNIYMAYLFNFIPLCVIQFFYILGNCNIIEYKNPSSSLVLMHFGILDDKARAFLSIFLINLGLFSNIRLINLLKLKAMESPEDEIVRRETAENIPNIRKIDFWGFVKVYSSLHIDKLSVLFMYFIAFLKIDISHMSKF